LVRSPDRDDPPAVLAFGEHDHVEHAFNRYGCDHPLLSVHPPTVNPYHGARPRRVTRQVERHPVFALVPEIFDRVELEEHFL